MSTIWNFRSSLPQIRLFYNTRHHLWTSSSRLGPIQDEIETKLRSSSLSYGISVLGGGSWGTAVADLISHNVIKYPKHFRPKVLLYLRDRKLCKTIETERENVKYLPGVCLSQNLRTINVLSEALSNSDILIFAVPHEYIEDLCYKIIKEDNFKRHKKIGISLIKGLHWDESEVKLETISQVIERLIGIPVGVLSGANVASEVAQKQYCEATLCLPQRGSRQTTTELEILRNLFQAKHFNVSLNQDQSTVELCGALKNVIACGAGLVDGLGFGINTKSTAITCGFRELISLIRIINPNFKMETLFQSCGLADVLASSFGGRNRKIGEAFARHQSNSTLEKLELRLLNGQKLQGPNTARCVYEFLTHNQHQDLIKSFPFFTMVHQIFNQNVDAKHLLDSIGSYPQT